MTIRGSSAAAENEGTVIVGVDDDAKPFDHGKLLERIKHGIRRLLNRSW